ncbi:leucyl aminopeptidase [Brevundimonas diminuta]|uniref:Probable cytosol aminopeptidase n=1 Tax=Brevundimonas diminuta TaxID=293 RepID=A0A1Z3LZ71_BREDI|nr:leucyl aminopeptidase [Brevundimonas diminuta]ASD27501.1 leucyl aminopeptidase [Brevundimonas diminuta]
MQISFVSRAAETAAPFAQAVLARSAEGKALDYAPQARVLDGATAGAVGRAAEAGRFVGSTGQILDILAPQGVDAARLLVIGVGCADFNDAEAVEIASARACRAIVTSGLSELVLDFGCTPETAARAALGARLSAYRFDNYKTRQKPDTAPSLLNLRILVDEPDAARQSYEALAALADGVVFSRDLVSEPSNILYPDAFAQRVKALESSGLEVEILGEAEMKTLGMDALLGVGQGSTRESRLAVIQWKGAADPEAAPVCFVGKGVCFDTGGISIKPSAGMDEMKTDMAGAAAAAGAMLALAGRKAKINVVAVLGLVENMPDGQAQRPGDVVKSMSGQTIEVIDTDAEGRLVLADALWYAKERFQPRVMIDLATLTGGVIVALGMDVAGLFSNDDDLADRLARAGEAEREPVWRLPLTKSYEKLIDSQIADLKNLAGRPASAITAALFLQRFVGDTLWAHIDLAASVWRKECADPTVPEGATAYGVRLLNTFVSGYEAGDAQGLQDS